jgi:hypothetical protein
MNPEDQNGSTEHQITDKFHPDALSRAGFAYMGHNAAEQGPALYFRRAMAGLTAA